MKRASKRDTGHHGRKAEVLTSKRLGARLQPGSGAKADAKGDMKVGDFLIENKATTYRSFALKHDYLIKIYLEALEVGKMPALSLQFTDGVGNSNPRARWVILREDHFMELAGVSE